MIGEVSAKLGSVNRTGRWVVPELLPVRLHLSSGELDFRDAVMPPSGLTTLDATVAFSSLEIIVPPHMHVELEASPFAGSVESRHTNPVDNNDLAPRLRIVGTVKFGSIEVVTRMSGESPDAAHLRERARRHAQRHGRHAEQHERWRALRAERELWREAHRRKQLDRRAWSPWWMQARMRKKIFLGMAAATGMGAWMGYRMSDGPRWWYIAIAVALVSLVSGAMAYRVTRPLIEVARAAREIGEGKLDTRIDVRRHGGEAQLVATAINDMAARIEQQIKDQKSLLAAVSHELRTPLGHMRVLIETARDTQQLKPLEELDREIIVLDDLVGKLLASSRLEFGNLDLRATDLGELATDVATSAGIAPEAIEAIGDVQAPIDATLVRRAIANLLDNARTYGGGAIAVRIERRAAQVAIEVDDAGPGVPADRRADAFRAFVPSSGGLGLGLALVSRIAVAHGGGAWITDRPGGGARIGFSLGA